jgi:hypothetical protein
MSDDPRNGDRPSMHPEAREALVDEIASRQTADERWIDDIDRRTKDLHDALDMFRRGDTEWQQSVSRRLQILTDEIVVLKIARVVWPGITAAAILFLGGACAELAWRLATLH